MQIGLLEVYGGQNVALPDAAEDGLQGLHLEAAIDHMGIQLFKIQNSPLAPRTFRYQEQD